MTKKQQTKLKIATVKASAIEYQGLLNPEDNCHYVGVSQVADLLFPVTKQNATYHVKQALGEDFQLLKYPTELNPKAVNVITVRQFRKVLTHFAFKGNSVAQDIINVLGDTALENIHNDAFGIKNTPENNQKIANKTLQAKYDEILNNDELDDFEKQIEVNMMFAQHDLEKGQAEKEKHTLKKKLLKEQMELEKIKDFLQKNARELNLNFDELDDLAEQVTSFFQTVFNNIDYLNQTEKEWYPVRVFIINKFPNYFKEGQHKVIGKICGQLHQKLDIPQKYRNSEYRSDLLWAICNAAKEYTQIKMKLVLDCAKKCLEIRLENEDENNLDSDDLI